MIDDTRPTDAELARLADDSLPEPARSTLRARVASSPELAARLREQERAVTLMRRTDELTAPASLRAQLAQLTGQPTAASPAGEQPAGQPPAVNRTRPRRHRSSLARLHPRVFLPVATAVAVAIAALVVLAGGRGAPTVAQTASVALSAAVLPAPAIDPSDGARLSARVGQAAFPSYAHTADWRASGARTDTLSGRRVMTVFYRDRTGERVGYAIVGGRPLATPRGRTLRYGSVRYVLASRGATRLITWRRDGHTCVIAGRGIRPRTLVRLAAADALAS